MREHLVHELKLSTRFGERDAVNLQALRPYAVPVIPVVVDQFYGRLMRYDGARAVLTGGPEQLGHLRQTLSTWLHELFEGRYDGVYYDKRRKIGTAHVRAGLPQHYMFLGMELIWEELERQISTAKPPQAREKLRSLHKLLMLDMAVMLESYKDSYAEQIRASERTTMEEQLTRAEHLAEIGQLAASLAHEIKNPLAGISGATQIIRDALSPGDPRQPIVDEILRQISRLDATVKDLLQYARPTPPRMKSVALGAVVKRVLTLLQEEPAMQRVRFAYHKPPTETVVRADDAQIEQLLINLLINAAHASEDGGVVHLGITGNAHEVLLAVRDEGKGMTPEVRQRAFEAFFTTKAKGTGLGLPICRRIVEAHGGSIDIDSDVGRGTRVRVTLPHGSPR